MSDVKTQRGGDILADFAKRGMAAQKAVNRVVSQFDHEPVSPAEIREAEAMFDEASTSGAVDLMADEIRQIAKAARAMLAGGLTEEAIIVLLQAKLPKERNGRPVAASHLHDVLHALAHLDSYTKPTGGKR